LKIFIKNAKRNLSLDKIEFTEQNVAYPGNGEGLWKSLWKAAPGGREWFQDSICADIDSVVDESWAQVSPGCDIDKDFWNIRWEGEIEPLFSETYTFYLTFNDIARLWVNNQLLIDGWLAGYSGSTLTGTIDVVAREKIPIQLDFGNYTGDSNIKLEWSSRLNLREVVPQSQLFPEIVTGQTKVNWIKPGIFPNPADDILQIKAYENRIEQIIIYDLKGKMIFYDNNPFEDTKTINIQNLHRGMYFMKIFMRGATFVQKLIIERE
jgi:hypothetical protein